jgi:hypothetical protein
MNKDETTPEEAFEVIDSNRWLILSRDDEGYAIWPVDNVDDDPIRSFPPTDEGAEDAYETFVALSQARRGSLVPLAMLMVAAIAGIAWLAATTYIAIAGLSAFDDRYQSWVYTTSQVGYPAFLVSSGLFVMTWMYRRERIRIL